MFMSSVYIFRATLLNILFEHKLNLEALSHLAPVQFLLTDQVEEDPAATGCHSDPLDALLEEKPVVGIGMDHTKECRGVTHHGPHQRRAMEAGLGGDFVERLCADGVERGVRGG